MTTVVSVRFRSGCKTYFFDPRELTVERRAGHHRGDGRRAPNTPSAVRATTRCRTQQVVQPLRPRAAHRHR